MQDYLAIAAACLAAGWLVRRLCSRLLAPPCRPPIPGGGDGFVPLDRVAVRTPSDPAGRAEIKPGRP